MRRIYFTSPMRQKITDDAMAEMRRTREKLDPLLLERARAAIAGETLQAQSHEPVDRKKMLAIAARLMELQPHNRSLKQLVSEFL